LKKIFTVFPGLILLFYIVPLVTNAQDIIKGSQVSGNFQADAQYYLTDSKMGITDSSLDGRLTRMNGFTEINYSFRNFSAGMRFEAYLPPLVGYDPKYEGYGVPYWFLNYKNDKLEITAGNFYEQFGNGLTLRTWQEWTLGFDNSLRGLRVKFTPVDGITLKGVWGVQRNYWEPYSNNNRGIVKGGDLDFFLNDIFKGLKDAKTKVSFGGSFVSNYQRGKTTDILVDTMIYTLKLPENVAMYSGRLNLNVGGINFYTEYAHKINDPSSINEYIYKNGNGLFTTLSYSQKGMGIQGSCKIIDNMSYKSNRLVTNNQLDINYLPAITKQHSYALAAMYPYATQPMGEFGVAGTFTYTFKRNTKIGGKSGLTLAINFSNVNSLSKDSVYVTGLNTMTMNQPGTLGYETHFFKPGNEKYYQDLNIEIDKKFSKQWKGIFTYLYQTYNKDIVEGHLNEYGIIYSNIGIADITWNLTNKFSLRGEFQGLWTKQDKGNWAAGLLEFTIAPQWFFSVQDQWNYGNENKNQQLHYYLISAGYTYNTSRITFSYGRQREGILCVGGVCRYVPAASGLTLSITSSF
jgi:hypothetical protein